MPQLQSNPKTLTAITQNVDLDVRDSDFASVSITGTFIATVTFRVSNDGGVNFFDFNGTPTTSPTGVTNATAPGAFSFDVRPWGTLRATTTAYTSGSAAVVVAGKQLS